MAEEFDFMFETKPITSPSPTVPGGDKFDFMFQDAQTPTPSPTFNLPQTQTPTKSFMPPMDQGMLSATGYTPPGLGDLRPETPGGALGTLKRAWSAAGAGTIAPLVSGINEMTKATIDKRKGWLEDIETNSYLHIPTNQAELQQYLEYRDRYKKASPAILKKLKSEMDAEKKVIPNLGEIWANRAGVQETDPNLFNREGVDWDLAHAGKAISYGQNVGRQEVNPTAMAMGESVVAPYMEASVDPRVYLGGAAAKEIIGASAKFLAKKFPWLQKEVPGFSDIFKKMTKRYGRKNAIKIMQKLNRQGKNYEEIKDILKEKHGIMGGEQPWKEFMKARRGAKGTQPPVPEPPPAQQIPPENKLLPPPKGTLLPEAPIQPPSSPPHSLAMVSTGTTPDVPPVPIPEIPVSQAPEAPEILKTARFQEEAEAGKLAPTDTTKQHAFFPASAKSELDKLGIKNTTMDRGKRMGQLRVSKKQWKKEQAPAETKTPPQPGENKALKEKESATLSSLGAGQGQKVWNSIKKVAAPINKALIDFDRKQSYGAVKLPDNLKHMETDFYDARETLLGQRNSETINANRKAVLWQEKIKASTGEKKFGEHSENIDAAIQMSLDLERATDEQALLTQVSKLSPRWRKIIKLSRMLTPEQKKIAQEIKSDYEIMGKRAMDEKVINNMIDDYVARAWKLEDKASTDVNRIFGTQSRHAKKRTIPTILDGLLAGLEPKFKSASKNYAVYHEEIENTIANKHLLAALKKYKIVVTKPPKDTRKNWKKIDSPNFRIWQLHTKLDIDALPQKDYEPYMEDEGISIRSYDPGDTFVKGDKIFILKEVYAPKEIADNINNIFGTSALRKNPTWRKISAIKETAKMLTLCGTFFHHWAYGASFLLFSKTGNATPWFKGQEYQMGLDRVKGWGPDVQKLTKAGLTIGLRADFDEAEIERLGVFKSIADAIPFLPAKQKKSLLRWKDEFTHFLFDQFGAGLKVQAAMQKLEDARKHFPHLSKEDDARLAESVATHINDDFGGLNLKKMGRNPTVQDVSRIFTLAVDWTESNIRLAVRSFVASGGLPRGGGGPGGKKPPGASDEEWARADRAINKNMWARAMLIGGVLTVGTNILLHRDKYPKAVWRAMSTKGKFDYNKFSTLKWMGVYLGQDKGGVDRWLNFFFRHSIDPAKGALHFFRFAYHKGSHITKGIVEVATGRNWRSDRFTTTGELWKKKKLTTPYSKRIGPLFSGEIPSYMLNQAGQLVPAGLQGTLDCIRGEWDGLAKIAGLQVSRVYPEGGSKKKKVGAIKKSRGKVGAIKKRRRETP